MELGVTLYLMYISECQIASKLGDVLAKNSAKARADLLPWPYFMPTLNEGYGQYFNGSN